MLFVVVNFVNYVTARRRQAKDGNIVLRMRFAGSITKSKKAQNQNI